MTYDAHVNLTEPEGQSRDHLALLFNFNTQAQAPKSVFYL